MTVAVGLAFAAAAGAALFVAFGGLRRADTGGEVGTRPEAVAAGPGREAHGKAAAEPTSASSTRLKSPLAVEPGPVEEAAVKVAEADEREAKAGPGGAGGTRPGDGGIRAWAEIPVRFVTRRAPARTTPLWDGRKVGLRAARNEHESFQLVLSARGEGGRVQLRASDLAAEGGRSIAARTIRIWEMKYVPYEGTDEITEPLVPIKEGLDVRSGTNAVVWVRLYVPPETSAGRYAGSITVETGEGKLDVPVEVEVLDFSLPDTWSFDRFSPYWSTASFVEICHGIEGYSGYWRDFLKKPKVDPDVTAERYQDLVLEYWRRLHRAGIAVAHGMEHKRPWWGYRGPEEVEFGATDPFFSWFFDKLKGRAIDIDF